MKKILVVLGIFVLIIISGIIYYNVGLSAVSSNKEEVEFLVDSGSTYYNVISKLKKEKLIRSELCFKIYIKLNKVNAIEAGTYKISKNMSVKDIVKLFDGGNKYNPDAIVITFKEGKNMRSIAKTIALYTNNTEEDVYNLMKDTSYLKELINNYWFIDNSILNKEIYYPLEGYLYPNTYEFKNKDVTVKEIFKILLDEANKQLTTLKDEIDKSDYNVHEILTFASIVELEAGKSKDKTGIAGVFINRLYNRMSLGSDVTAYYGAQVDLNERNLYEEEITDQNAYNTRSSHLAGKLPVGPICNPSIESIKAVLEPEENEYFYFVSDKNGSTYFTKNYQEHQNMIKALKEEGLWYYYE